MDNFFEAGGYATAGTSIILQIADSLDITHVNPLLTTLTGIAGFIFLIYKIVNIRIDTKIKRETLDSLRKEEESNKEDE